MIALMSLFVTAALLSTQCAQAAGINRKMKLIPIELEIDNNLEPNLFQTKKNTINKFLYIAQRPPPMISHYSGNTIELTCEAIGYPTPTVQWLKNDMPILEYDFETNDILDRSMSGVARVVSTLMITDASRRREDVYTCLAVSDRKTSSAATTVYTIDSNTDLTERFQLDPITPKIVLNYKLYMDEIGSNVIIPCKAKGHPHPAVFWQDNEGNFITRRHPRMKVLKTGELLVKNIRWADMGQYTCTAKNTLGEDTATTFIYPLKAG